MARTSTTRGTSAHRLGLVVRLTSGSKLSERIKKQRVVPLSGMPREVGPGATVAFVDSAHRVVAMSRIQGVDRATNVQMLTGTRRLNGVHLRLSRLTRPPASAQIVARWHAVGQFKYFDTRTWSVVVVGDNTGGDWTRTPDDRPDREARSMRFHPFLGGIPGQDRDHPESRLVRQYVEWLKASEDFGHQFLPALRLYVDLFDRRRWRLIEAKVGSDRKTLRQAVGQLMDYRRAYPRKPSLGVLLGCKPSPASLDFLRACRVAAVWQTPQGSFRDSLDAEWTSKRRALT